MNKHKSCKLGPIENHQGAIVQEGKALKKKSAKYSPKYVHGPKMAHYCVKSDSIIADRSRMISTVLNQFSILDFQYRLD